MDPYAYSPGDPQFDLRIDRETDCWRRYAVSFPTALPTMHREGRTVRGEYYQPRVAGKAPLLVLLHGVGDASVLPCRLLARSLAAGGIACFVLYLIVHSGRMPAEMRRRMPHLSDDEWFESYRTSVVEVRQLADWAAVRAEIDESKVGVLGISFGGFVSAIAMGVDERIRAGVFLVSGGNSSKLVRRSRLGGLLSRYRITEKEYQETQREFAQYLAQIARRGFGQVAPPRRSFLTDPVTFAAALRQRPALMINARWDELVPRESTVDLWRACGQPPISWFPATHATIWLWYPLIRRRVQRFLWDAFGL